jgi:hypothetical protein
MQAGACSPWKRAKSGGCFGACSDRKSMHLSASQCTERISCIC